MRLSRLTARVVMTLRRRIDVLSRLKQEAVHLVVKRCPCAILWIARWHKLYSYADRRFTCGKRSGQRKLFIAPAAAMSIDINAGRYTSAVPGASELSIDIDIGSLV